MCIHAIVLFIIRWQWCTKEMGYIKLEIVMRKHAKHSHAHVNSFLRAQKSFLCACKSLYFFILGTLCVILRKSMKKPWENKNIYKWLYYIPNIKLKIMLHEPFMLNMVWKSTERFVNLSLEKYGILKWKMCRNPGYRMLQPEFRKCWDVFLNLNKMETKRLSNHLSQYFIHSKQNITNV